MPPWPPRLHLGYPAPYHPPSRPKSRGLGSLHTRDQDIDRQYEDPPLFDVPVLRSRNSTAPSPPEHRPRHGRSYSNPFTSLFGSGKKAENMDDDEIQNNAVDTVNGVVGLPPRPQSKEHMSGVIGGSPQATGKCSTCDSTMKWPQHLDSFRCQVCLMINDLKPASSPLGEGLTVGNPYNPASSMAGVPKKGEL